MGDATKSKDLATEPPRGPRGAVPGAYQAAFKLSSSAFIDPRPRPEGNTSDFLVADLGEGKYVSELQPQDGGFGAWSYVAAAFSMYIVVWGFPQAFPIFQTYLTTGPDAAFPDSIAITFLAPGLQDIEEGILVPFLPMATRHRRSLLVLDIFIMMISLVLAANSSKDWQIVLTQGVTFGIGGVLMNFVHVSAFPEWFDKKKGRAMGIIWTGWRVGTLAFPPTCQWLLNKHGFQKTLYMITALMLSLLLPSILLIRGRYHAAVVRTEPIHPPIPRLQALRAPSVLYYLFASSLFFLATNVPRMFITTFAADIRLSRSDQAMALVCLTIGNILATYLLSWLSDAVHHEILTASLAFATSASNIIGLGFARGKSGVFFYGIITGLASGGFSSCLFTFYGDLANGNGRLFTAIHGLFSFFRGAAILSVGPVGAGLLHRAPAVNLDGFAVDRYRNLLAYASILPFVSGALILGRY